MESTNNNQTYLKADESIVKGKRVLKCNYCGYEWSPRKATPKQCPQCKRVIIVTNNMAEITRGKILASLPEVGDVKQAVPEYFTPECVRCGKEAEVTYRKNFMCGMCAVEQMKEDGVIKEQ